MGFPFGQTVTLQQRTVTGVDADGNDTYTATSTDVTGCAFNPGPSIETVQGQDMIVDTPTLYMPAGTVVSAYDRLVVAGVTYEVSGSPNFWKSPFSGWDPGVVVSLKGVSG